MSVSPDICTLLTATISTLIPVRLRRFLLVLCILFGIDTLLLPTAYAHDPPPPAPQMLQPAQPHIDYITADDGLAPGIITELLRDQQGFLWIGTQNGLHRYDGYELVKYTHDPKTPHSISGNLIHDIVEDQQGHLWIAAGESGVNRYDPATDQFTRYQHNPADPDSLSGLVAVTVYADRSGTIWVGTLNGDTPGHVSVHGFKEK